MRNVIEITCLFLITLFTTGTIAQRDESDDSRREKGKSSRQQAFVHPLTNMPNSAVDIRTSYFFPKHTDQKFPIGETVTVLCHLINEGQTSYNITAVMGSLNSPFDFNFHIQNYTYKPFGIVVKAGEEYTFDYQFQLHQSLEPVEYAVAHTIFYEDDSESFSSTFFNQTVELYYPNNEYDFETVGQLSFSLFATVFVALMLYHGCNPESKLMDATEKLIRKGRRVQSVGDDWTEGAATAAAAAPRKRTPKKSD